MSRKSSISNRKADIGISINMVVIIALAVFAVFLIMGFVTGGWSYFTGAFKGATGGTGGYEAAKIRCDQFCVSYQGAGCPTSGYAFERLKQSQAFGYDTNNDGVSNNDFFSCLGSCSAPSGFEGTEGEGTEGECIDSVISNCKCSSVSAETEAADAGGAAAGGDIVK